MQQLNYLAAHTHKSAVNLQNRSVEAIFSSETVDGHGEIVDQSTWKLDRYRKNPVILYMHSPYDVIGHAENIRVVDGALVARVVFATTKQADEVLTLFKDGAMRAFSVGFRVGRVEQQSINGRNVRRLLDCDLMEVSAVSIPSNPDAVVRHKSLGLVPESFELPRDPSAEIAEIAAKSAGVWLPGPRKPERNERPEPEWDASAEIMRLASEMGKKSDSQRLDDEIKASLDAIFGGEVA